MQNVSDFNTLLMLEMDKEESYENNCLITNEPLEKSHIKLTCTHSFNYKPLLNEVCKQKINLIRGKKYSNNLEIQKLTKYQMKCPYCRTIQNGILPYIKTHPKIRYVNWPQKQALKLNKCPYQFKSGKRKNQPCNKFCCFEYCKQHLNLLEKRNVKKENKNIIKCTALTRKGNQCSRKSFSSLQPFCLQHSKLLKNKKKIPGTNTTSICQPVTI
ncbi:MAG: hypothetical protein CBC84_002315 [Pelagibacteraceae bacterium TMED124]|nr:MAG: hypothetical protein CBC84_002315 [Pelagibacteraceae bacterium TMED124]|tara:strand:- start:410 stop:1051 length:642 start_codon:yes stop_codon:yes gene_type:complete